LEQAFKPRFPAGNGFIPYPNGTGLSCPNGRIRAGKERDFMCTIDDNAASRPSRVDGVPNMTKKVGNTTYEVYVHFSETSKETMTDKVLRLIRNEVLSKG
jgi:hypothetical protein